MTVDIFSKRVAVASYADASKKVRAAIERPGGLGEWIPGSKWRGGTIRDPEGKTIARVSYNGRVWDLDDKEIVVEATTAPATKIEATPAKTKTIADELLLGTLNPIESMRISPAERHELIRRAAATIDNDANAFRAIIQILNGSQPIDIPGAIMVAHAALAKIGGGS